MILVFPAYACTDDNAAAANVSRDRGVLNRSRFAKANGTAAAS